MLCNSNYSCVFSLSLHIVTTPVYEITIFFPIFCGKTLVDYLELFQGPIKNEKFVYSVSIQSSSFVVELFYIYFYKHL